MATKDDVRLILDRIDVFDKKVVVHDHRLSELEPRVERHEKRLVKLESLN